MRFTGVVEVAVVMVEGVGGKASGVALVVCDGFGCWVVGWGGSGGVVFLGAAGTWCGVFEVGGSEVWVCQVGEKSWSVVSA